MKTSVVIFLLLFSLALRAQDVHLSQINASPLNLNPALAGFHYGDYRIIANFRSQWGGFTMPYKTAAASAEGSFFKGKMRTDFIGMGLQFFHDWSGDTRLKTTHISYSFSWHKYLGYYKKSAIALGFQGGAVERRIDLNELTWSSQYDGVSGNSAIPSGESFPSNSIIIPDLSAGLIYHFLPNRWVNGFVGGSYFHILRPDISFHGRGDRLHSKAVLHFGVRMEASNKLNILPTAAFLWQGPYLQGYGGSYFQVLLSEFYDTETAFALGLFGRYSGTQTDAIIFATRVDFANVTIGFSYDMNISNLKAASKYRGGYEISIAYTGIVTTPGKRAFTIPCPNVF